MVICRLERGANALHVVQLMPLPPIISCFVKIKIRLIFLVPAYPGCPGKRPLNGRLSYVLHWNVELQLHVSYGFPSMLWRHSLGDRRTFDPVRKTCYPKGSLPKQVEEENQWVTS